MRKNDLVHLHGLLIEVTDRLTEDDALSQTDLEPYDQLGVAPVSFQASREDHQEAVLTLGAVLGDAARSSFDGSAPNSSDDGEAGDGQSGSGSTDGGRPTAGTSGGSTGPWER